MIKEPQLVAGALRADLHPDFVKSELRGCTYYAATDRYFLRATKQGAGWRLYVDDYDDFAWSRELEGSRRDARMFLERFVRQVRDEKDLLALGFRYLG